MPKGPSQTSVQQLKRLIEKYNEAVFELRRRTEEHMAHEANERNEENLREFNEKTNRDNEEHFRKLALESNPEEKNESLQAETTPHPEYKPSHQKVEKETPEEHLKNTEHLHQLLHELRAELIHLEAIHHQLNESEPEKHAEKGHFFKHHAETLAHANQHWFHARHYLELLFEFELEEEFEELLMLQHHMKHLVEEIEREQNELTHAFNHSPLQPHPEPPHPKDEKEDKAD